MDAGLLENIPPPAVFYVLSERMSTFDNKPTPDAPVTATPQKSRDVMQLEPDDQKKWLKQRGWALGFRDKVELWRHPETGVRYVFGQAIKMALQDCRLPADYELKPEVNNKKFED